MQFVSRPCPQIWPRSAVELKVLMEQMREQVQNVE
jgi:uncharacterized protein YicC (UPF0701 family)